MYIEGGNNWKSKNQSRYFRDKLDKDAIGLTYTIS